MTNDEITTRYVVLRLRGVSGYMLQVFTIGCSYIGRMSNDGEILCGRAIDRSCENYGRPSISDPTCPDCKELLRLFESELDDHDKKVFNDKR